MTLIPQDNDKRLNGNAASTVVNSWSGLPPFRMYPFREEDPYFKPSLGDPRIFATRPQGKRPDLSNVMRFTTEDQIRSYLKEVDARCKRIAQGLPADSDKQAVDYYIEALLPDEREEQLSEIKFEAYRNYERSKRLDKKAKKEDIPDDSVDEFAEPDYTLGEPKPATQDVKAETKSKVEAKPKQQKPKAAKAPIPAHLMRKPTNPKPKAPSPLSAEDEELLREYYPTEGYHCKERLSIPLHLKMLQKHAYERKITAFTSGGPTPFKGWRASTIVKLNEVLKTEGYYQAITFILESLEAKELELLSTSDLGFKDPDALNYVNGVLVNMWYVFDLTVEERALYRNAFRCREGYVACFKYAAYADLLTEQMYKCGGLPDEVKAWFGRAGQPRRKAITERIHAYFKLAMPKQIQM